MHDYLQAECEVFVIIYRRKTLSQNVGVQGVEEEEEWGGWVDGVCVCVCVCGGGGVVWRPRPSRIARRLRVLKTMQYPS